MLLLYPIETRVSDNLAPKSHSDFASATPKYRASHDASSLRSDLRNPPTSRMLGGSLLKPSSIAQW